MINHIFSSTSAIFNGGIVTMASVTMASGLRPRTA